MWHYFKPCVYKSWGFYWPKNMQHVAVGMEHLKFEFNVKNNNNTKAIILFTISRSLSLMRILALPGSWCFPGSHLEHSTQGTTLWICGGKELVEIECASHHGLSIGLLLQFQVLCSTGWPAKRRARIILLYILWRSPNTPVFWFVRSYLCSFEVD